MKSVMEGIRDEGKDWCTGMEEASEDLLDKASLQNESMGTEITEKGK